VSSTSDWDARVPDEPLFSGAETDGPWDEDDEDGPWEPGVADDQLWDAFDLDDSPEEAEPEYGDFWPEAGDAEEVD
jgi:hypothetical protein